MIEFLSKVDWRTVTVVLLFVALVLELFNTALTEKKVAFLTQQLIMNRVVLSIFKTIFGDPTEEQIKNAMLELETERNKFQNESKDNDTPK